MLLKKLLLSLFLVLFFSFNVYSADIPSLSAQSAILINADTKEIIYEKNAYQRRSMASTTKIMTSILAIESGRLNEVVTAENMSAEGSSIGLRTGNKLTLETLVWGMLLESGNDAAKLTANHIAGSEEAFAKLMNDKSVAIGMTDTNFVTASGLDDSQHYSTAFDMALLGAYAIKNPIFSEMCSAKVKTVDFIEPDISLTFSNHNRLLSMYDGVFGVKTGFTKKSGRCLVSACSRDGVNFVAVTLNAGDDWNDHIKLYDYGFENLRYKDVYLRLPDCIRVYGSEKCECNISISKSPLTVAVSENVKGLQQKIYLPSFLYAPVKKGEIIGKVELYSDDRLISVVNILAADDIGSISPMPEKENILKKLADKITDFFKQPKGK